MFAPWARRFCIFVAASALVHAALLSELPGWMGMTEPAPTPLTAELIAPQPEAPPAKPAPPPRAPRVAARPRPAPVPPPEPAQPHVERLPLARTEVPTDSDPVAAEPPAAEPPVDVAAAEPQSPPDPSPEPVPPPATEAPAPRVLATSAPPIRDLPRAGAIRYEVLYGADKFPIGRTVLVWTMDNDAYRMSSTWETTGLVGFFRPFQLSYVSEGRVDAAEGLRPDMFSARRGRDGERQAAARFDWPALKLTLGTPAQPQSVALPPGTLDRLSFIYQLARSDLSPRRTQLRITDGSKLETYTLEIGATETIELPLGTLRTVPIRQIRALGRESIEVWLAPERHFLPVRIRHFTRDGKMSGEQIATEITTNAR